MRTLLNSGVSQLSHRSIDLSNHVHLGLKGGSKRVQWKKIEANNKWYIGGDFLLRGKTFFNPTRLHEDVLYAYWKHLYQLSRSGTSLTFKTTHAPRLADQDDFEEDEPETGEAGGHRAPAPGDRQDPTPGGRQDQTPGSRQDPTPSQCITDKQKVKFLRSMHPDNQIYQGIIGILAQMGVSFLTLLWICWLISECM